MKDFKIGETLTIGQKELIVVESNDGICDQCVLQNFCNETAYSLFTSIFGHCDCVNREDKTNIHFQWKEETV